LTEPTDLAGLILADQHEAQVATQDALLRAWPSDASLRDPAGFQAWSTGSLIDQPARIGSRIALAR